MLLFAVESVTHTGEAAGLLVVVVLLEEVAVLLLGDDVDELCYGEDAVEEVSDGDNNSHNYHSLHLLLCLH